MGITTVRLLSSLWVPFYGRTYKDFVSYTDENDIVSIVEMDTVYNGQSGPFMQTFKFLSYSFMFIIYHEEKTAKAMVEGVDLLESILGEDLFKKEVEVIKTDYTEENTMPKVLISAWYFKFWLNFFGIVFILEVQQLKEVL